MQKYFTELTEYIKDKDEYHYQELLKNIEGIENSYFVKVEVLLQKFDELMRKMGHTYTYGINCYLKKNEDLFDEFLEFSRSGRYKYSSFEEVKKRVYDDSNIMEYHTIGLLLMQILRATNYKKLKFFHNVIDCIPKIISNYLEIGGGHGLYLDEAYDRMIEKDCNFYYLDISEKSVEIAKHFLDKKEIKFILADIFDFTGHKDFDFITLGEVLEHVENPLHLLKVINNLLIPGGYLFLTVPMNMPAIDHIFLFTEPSEIKKLIREAGFDFVEELALPEFEKIRNDNNLKLASSFVALCQKR